MTKLHKLTLAALAMIGLAVVLPFPFGVAALGGAFALALGAAEAVGGARC